MACRYTLRLREMYQRSFILRLTVITLPPKQASRRDSSYTNTAPRLVASALPLSKYLLDTRAISTPCAQLQLGPRSLRPPSVLHASHASIPEPLELYQDNTTVSTVTAYAPRSTSLPLHRVRRFPWPCFFDVFSISLLAFLVILPSLPFCILSEHSQTAQATLRGLHQE